MGKQPLYPHIPGGTKPYPQWTGPLLPRTWRDSQLIFQDSFIEDNLYQVWERTRGTVDTGVRFIRAEARVYTEWKDVPKKDWNVMLSDGLVYYDIYPWGYSGMETEPIGRIIDIVTIKRGIGLGVNLVRLAEKRMGTYGVQKVEGSAVPEARDFWRKMGYSLENGEMAKVTNG